MNKYGFVYIWRDRKHARYYIGSHWGTEDDGYVCSSPWMRQAHKHRPEDFKRRILFRTDNRVLLREKEAEWLQLIKPEEIKERYYNLNIGETGHWTSYPENVKTIKEKISYQTKQAMWRPEVRKRMLKGNETRDYNSHSPEVRKKMSEALKGKMPKNFEEFRKKGSEVNRGRKLTEEHKAKVLKSIQKLHSCPHCDRKMNKGNLVKHMRVCN